EAEFRRWRASPMAAVREHLERVPRYRPSRAGRLSREQFDERGMRLILIDGERAGCVGFRVGQDEIKFDSFYLARRYHNRGLGTAMLKTLLAEADSLGLPVQLDVLRGSPAGRFYLRHGFVKLSEDEIEATYERPLPIDRPHPAKAS